MQIRHIRNHSTQFQVAPLLRPCESQQTGSEFGVEEARLSEYSPTMRSTRDFAREYSEVIPCLRSGGASQEQDMGSGEPLWAHGAVLY
jgi:hypothetical protein